MFGAPIKNLTFIHVIEDMIGEDSFPVHIYDPHRYPVDLFNENGMKTTGCFRAHSLKSGRIRARGNGEFIETINNLPSTKVYSLGCGEVILIDAKDLCLCLLSLLKKGITTMGHRKVSEACKKKADEWIDYLNRL